MIIHLLLNLRICISEINSWKEDEEGPIEPFNPTGIPTNEGGLKAVFDEALPLERALEVTMTLAGRKPGISG